MSQKSETCFSKHSGEGLSEYDSEHEAQDAGEYINNEYERNLIPYRCRRCGLWHLSPADRQTPSSTCPYCTDSHGQFKKNYVSQEVAIQRTNIIWEERRISLSIYPCPYGDGYHLTKA